LTKHKFFAIVKFMKKPQALNTKNVITGVALAGSLIASEQTASSAKEPAAVAKKAHIKELEKQTERDLVLGKKVVFANVNVATKTQLQTGGVSAESTESGGQPALDGAIPMYRYLNAPLIKRGKEHASHPQRNDLEVGDYIGSLTLKAGMPKVEYVPYDPSTMIYTRTNPDQPFFDKFTFPANAGGTQVAGQEYIPAKA
jgi:hypothetical protein